MTIIFQSNFTKNGISDWSYPNGTPQIVASPFQTGLSNLLVNANAVWLMKNITPAPAAHVAFPIYITSIQAGASSSFLTIREQVTGVPICSLSLRLDSDGVIHLYGSSMDTGDVLEYIPALGAIPLNTMALVEIAFTSNTANGFQIWLNGTLIYACAGVTSPRLNGAVQVGGNYIEGTPNIYIGDVTVADSYIGTAPPPPPSGTTLTILAPVVVGGTTNPVPGTYGPYTSANVIPITATVSSGYALDDWYIDGLYASSWLGKPVPVTVYATMNVNHTIQPVFVSTAPPPPPGQGVIIGNTNGTPSGGQNGPYTGPNKYGIVVTATASGIVDRVCAYLAHPWGYGGTPWVMRAAIYTWDDAGVTGNLLAASAERDMSDLPNVPSTTAGLLVQFLLVDSSGRPTTVNITQGQKYFICLMQGGDPGWACQVSGQFGGTNGVSFLWAIDYTKEPSPTIAGNMTGVACPVSGCVDSNGINTTCIYGHCGYNPYWFDYAIYARLGPTPFGVSVTPATATAPVTISRDFTAQVVGGTPPYTVVWTQGSTPLGTGSVVTVTESTIGTYTIQAQATDSSTPKQSATATAQFIAIAFPTEQPPYQLPVLPDFPTVPDAILPPTTFQYTMDKDVSGKYIIKDQTGTVVYSNTDPQLTLQQLITLTQTASTQSLVKATVGTVNMAAVQNSGSGEESSLNFSQSPAKIYLESGVNLINTVPVLHKGILRFDGRFQTNPDPMRNGYIFEGINGLAKITGQGSYIGETGVYVRMTSHLQLRHLEITNAGLGGIGFDEDAGNEAPGHNDDNFFEDLYIHHWGTALTNIFQAPAEGFGIDGSRGVYKNIRIDGESLPNGARCGILVWLENTTSIDNIFQDLDIRNVIHEAIYLCAGDTCAVSRQYFRRVYVNNACQQGGYSGVKLRPAYYCLFEDLTIENCGYAGLTLGQWIGTAPAAPSGDDGFGGINDGGNRGNRFIRTVINNSKLCNINLDIDHDGLTTEQNYLDVHITGGGMGIWFNNGIPGSSGNGIQRDNTFFVTIDSCAKAIVMGASLANGALTYRNHVTGVIKNCAIVAQILDVGCEDNYFDLAIIGGGTITDNGTRNRWNGVGKYAYGVGVIPPAADWNDGDIIINTSDNTTWFKNSSGAIVSLTSGQAIVQFAYMDGKGGLAPGVTQFIDKSFVSGRTIASWLWNFGDGSATSTLQHPVHPYATLGNYNVTLTITDSLGAQTTVTQAISVLTQGPATVTTLTVQAAANGTTTPLPGTYSEAIGSVVPITAIPNAGYKLVDWLFDRVSQLPYWPSGTNPLPITMDANHTVQPVFALNQITLTVTASANGTVAPSGAQTLIIGNNYSFAAIPNAGYLLDHWDLNGANQGSTNPLPLVAAAGMNGQTLTAVFTAIPPVQVTVNIATSGNGYVNLANGPHTFNVGDVVTFTATPNVNNAFREWTLDGATYTANPLQLQITQLMNGQTLTADFALTAIALTAAAGPNGAVSTPGPLILQVGQQYLFQAKPDPGYLFDHWDLAGASLGSSNPLTITATAAMNGQILTALFTVIPPVQVSLNIAASGSGTTNPAPGPHTFNVGDTVQLTAIPAAGQTFKQWTLDGTVYTANPLSLNITANMQGMTLTAEFTGPQGGGLDLPTVGGILIGVADVGLLAYGLAHAAGLV
jgi:PKD repeat protein